MLDVSAIERAWKRSTRAPLRKLREKYERALLILEIIRIQEQHKRYLEQATADALAITQEPARKRRLEEIWQEKVTSQKMILKMLKDLSLTDSKQVIEKEKKLEKIVKLHGRLDMDLAAAESEIERSEILLKYTKILRLTIDQSRFAFWKAPPLARQGLHLQEMRKNGIHDVPGLRGGHLPQLLLR